MPLITLQDALALIAARFTSVVATREVGVEDAPGRILAEAVTSPRALPATDNSAVDGYALGPGDAPFTLVGRAAAGHPFGAELAEGQAVRIFTGAVVPAGTIAIAMQENCRRDADQVRADPMPPAEANIRRAGEVLRPGDEVLPAGMRLSTFHLGLLADLGCDRLRVCAPLRVALLSSGDELRPAGTPIEPHLVIDSNRPLLRGLLRRLGCDTREWPILPDDRAAIRDALHAAAAENDLVITTAGMSVGEEDHIPVLLREAGGMLFHRLALKPGRPVGLGFVGDTPVLGLPGNPGAVAVTFTLIGQYLVRLLSGEVSRDLPRLSLPAAFSYRKPAGDRAVLPARLAPGGVERVARNAAGNLAWTVGADGFVEIREETTHISPGDPVAFLPFAGVLA